MSRPAWAGKRRDETEPDIVTALERAGAKVERLDRPCDLVVRYRDVLYLIEVDGITKNRKRDAGQVEFLAEWDVPRVKTPEEALRVVGAIR
jgi:hypothetical protein